VRPTKNRFEIIEKQLIRQVLHVKLDVHGHPFLLHEIGADREIENRAWLDATALKVDLVVQTWIEAARDEVRECRPGVDFRRYA
jgi:hypothetical protein